MDGETLFDITETYHELGIHQSGTTVDTATAAWLAAELEAREMSVALQPVPFDRYVCESSLVVDGEAVDHLPLFYEWVGEIETTDVGVRMVDARGGGSVGLIDDVVADAAGSGRAASVLATDHPNGSLVAVNRSPSLGSGHPIVLVAGRDHQRLAGAAEVTLRMRAGIERTATTNVIARNPAALAADHEPVLFTTPLTGWVRAAGERGTGVAIFLEMMERFVDTPVGAVACGGHELDHLGVNHWLDNRHVEPTAVVHLGASVAVDHPTPAGRVLAPTRAGVTNATGRRGDAMRAALTPGRLAIRTGTDQWVGESRTLQVLGVPMLSIAGGGIDFHTHEDTPARATSPAALAVMADIVEDATRILIN